MTATATTVELPLTQAWPPPIRQLILAGRAALAGGQTGDAAQAFANALRMEPNIPEAHLGLALARRPGPDYLAWLAQLQAALRPALYLEIGVETGRSLRLAQAPTIAIGIDPAPQISSEAGWSADIRIHRCTSQDFFADPTARASLPGPVDFAFIDGDHRFETVLHDVIAVETAMHPAGVIAIHDTWPLTAQTASRERQTGFYTGDGWKIVPCLRALRPDLRLLTIRTAPTGLTLVTGFDPASTRLRDRAAAIVEAYRDLPFTPSAAQSLALRDNTPASLDQFLGRRAMATAKSS